MTPTLELIAEQLWHRYKARVTLQHDEAGWKCLLSTRGGDPLPIATGNSALVALERARAELDKGQTT